MEGKMNGVKNALVVTVNDVIFSYDLFILDVWNQNQHILGDRDDIKEMIMKCFTTETSPLFSVIEENGKLVLFDLVAHRESTYKAKSDFIRTKANSNITLEVYKKLISENIVSVFRTTKPSFHNINLYMPSFLSNDNNFILIYNTLERDMLVSLLQDETKIIELDRFGDWIKKHVDTDDDNGIIISIISDDPDIVSKMAKTMDWIGEAGKEYLAQVDSLVLPDTISNREWIKWMEAQNKESYFIGIKNLFDFGNTSFK